MKNALIATAIAVTSPFAVASGYIGGSYSALDYSQQGLEKDLSLGAISVTGGYRFNEYAAIEARAGIGVGDDSLRGVTFELDTYYGGYLKLGIPAGDFYPYVLAGFTEGELTASLLDDSVSGSESDFSYGAGIGYNINKNVSLQLEYTNYLDKDGGTIDGFTFGINYYF
ncbi:porin family protein [Shewanella sp. GXUN23E]|uniref:porin family protein n=1 Tax=Shewanella sp. GXUN23E TaxID=3422498 RepID=UPI003D7E920B